jgi:hypothetical protein
MSENTVINSEASGLNAALVRSVEAAREVQAPFFHLEFDQVFPPDIYCRMMESMPVSSDYRALPGRNNVNITEKGVSTRIKVDLFREYIRHFAAQKRELWRQVGDALCSREVQAAFVRRLAPAMERRFGPEFRKVGLFPIPILTRDTGGYRIPEHTDTQWKGITVQFYLPADQSITHVGTIFSERLPDGSFRPTTRMKFAPNTGYAFAVGTDTWHSVDPVGPEVKSRDSILLTYFVDAGVLRFFRNRGRRLGNCALNELRRIGRLFQSADAGTS